MRTFGIFQLNHAYFGKKRRISENSLLFNHHQNCLPHYLSLFQTHHQDGDLMWNRKIIFKSAKSHEFIWNFAVESCLLRQKTTNFGKLSLIQSSSELSSALVIFISNTSTGWNFNGESKNNLQKYDK